MKVLVDRYRSEFENSKVRLLGFLYTRYSDHLFDKIRVAHYTKTRKYCSATNSYDGWVIDKLNIGIYGVQPYLSIQNRAPKNMYGNYCFWVVVYYSPTKKKYDIFDFNKSRLQEDYFYFKSNYL